MQGRGFRAWAHSTVIALLLCWPLPPCPYLCHCSPVCPIPAILIPLLVIIICSLSLSFVPPPPPHLVLITMWSSLLSSLPLFHRGPHPSPSYHCLVLVLVVIHGPPSPTSLVHCQAPTIHPASRGSQWCGGCWVSFIISTSS